MPGNFYYMEFISLYRSWVCRGLVLLSLYFMGVGLLLG